MYVGFSVRDWGLGFRASGLGPGGQGFEKDYGGRFES